MTSESTNPAIDAVSIAELIASIQRLTLAINAQMAANTSPPDPPSTVAPPRVVAPTVTIPEPAADRPPPGLGPVLPGAAATQTSSGISPSELAVYLANLPGPTDVPWYTVTRGRRRVGVFSAWDEISPLVIRVSTACFKKHPSQEGAFAAYQRAWDRGDVQVLS